MAQEIKTICLALPFKMGSVNCYLIETGVGYILIDSGCKNKRAELVRELEKAGCRPGDLKLIVLTHGDFDHTGNATYLREKYGAKLTLHLEDSVMIERGDMFLNRKKTNILIRKLTPILFGFGKAERCEPDFHVE
ncbi:MAG: MBL fold metallo-hydrolase, partial [Thermoleophilia bacterium]|nr:MBL fold metallo-hydrolase [Thermoleophilia bacterium]